MPSLALILILALASASAAAAEPAPQFDVSGEASYDKYEGIRRLCEDDMILRNDTAVSGHDPAGIAISMLLVAKGADGRSRALTFSLDSKFRDENGLKSKKVFRYFAVGADLRELKNVPPIWRIDTSDEKGVKYATGPRPEEKERFCRLVRAALSAPAAKRAAAAPPPVQSSDRKLNLKIIAKPSFAAFAKVGQLCGGALDVRNENMFSGKDPEGVATMIYVVGRDKAGKEQAVGFILQNSRAESPPPRPSQGFYYAALGPNMEKVRSVPVVHRMDMSRGEGLKWKTWVSTRDEKTFCELLTAALGS